MTSANKIGHFFALCSATLFGYAVGVFTEHSGSVSSRLNNDSNMTMEQGQRQIQLPEENSFQRIHNVPGTSGQISELIQKTISKGIPSDERVRFFDGYVASLNYERRVPNWVLEYFSPFSSAEKTLKDHGKLKKRENKEVGDGGDENNERNSEYGVVKRDGMKFLADSSVPEMFRVAPDDYVSGKQQDTRGLSRGHLAAAQFHKGSLKEMEQTFNMNANIVPQDMTMNAVDWLRLENLVKKLRRRYEGGLWVVSGPVFHPRYIYGDLRSWRWDTTSCASSAITPAEGAGGTPQQAKKTRKVVCYELVGKHDVSVPTHLFKVILGERADGTHDIAAFLMPNEPIATERPLVTYQVPVAEIERKTGLQFFHDAVLNNGASKMFLWSNGHNSKAHSVGLDMLPNICHRTSCEVQTAPLFQAYRTVAQLRNAQSLPELEKIFAELFNRPQSNTEKPFHLDAVVIKEYEDKKKELKANE